MDSKTYESSKLATLLDGSMVAAISQLAFILRGILNGIDVPSRSSPKLGKGKTMKYAIAAAVLFASAAGAVAQAPSATKPATPPASPAVKVQATESCKAQATTKKLAGAALTSFMKKCEQTAATACNKSAADQKLKGAAKTSHTTKCVKERVGS